MNDHVTARRVVGRPWSKGQSGNPGGRKRDEGKVRDLARKYTVEAINTLARIMRHGENDRVKAIAADSLLDRGWGRPMQAVEVSGEDGTAMVFTLMPGVTQPANGNGKHGA